MTRKRTTLVTLSIIAIFGIALGGGIYFHTPQAIAANVVCPNTDTDPYYEVSSGGLADHSVVDEITIQECLNQARDNGLLGIDLVTDGSYPVANTITVHEGLWLRNQSTSWSTGGAITATSSFPTTNVLVKLNNDSHLYKLELNGNHRAKQIVNAVDTSGATIRLNAIHKTTLTSTEDTADQDFHLINAARSQDIVISGNLMRRAGVSGPTNSPGPSPQADTGAGIHLIESEGATVSGNDIGYMLTAGVDFTNSLDVTITDNSIFFSGMGVLSGLKSADGITAYHNVLIPTGTSMNAVITYNTITRWHNNGIHVSGKGITIDHNAVDRGEKALNGVGNAGRTIRLEDHKSPPDCTYGISIQYNRLGKDTHGTYGLIGAKHKPHSSGFPGSMWPTQNKDYDDNSAITNSEFTIDDSASHC